MLKPAEIDGFPLLCALLVVLGLSDVPLYGYDHPTTPSTSKLLCSSASHFDVEQRAHESPIYAYQLKLQTINQTAV